MHDSVKVIRKARIDEKSRKENGRWCMRSRRKLKCDQLFTEIVIFFGKRDSFLDFIDGFNFDREMVGEFWQFFSVNVGALTKDSLWSNCPIIPEKENCEVEVMYSSNFAPLHFQIFYQYIFRKP